MATASGYASAYGMPSAELVRDDDVELTRPGLLGRFVGCFAVHDFVMLGHLTVMWVLVAGARSATGAPASLLRIEATMAILLVGCLLARGTRIPAILRSGAYRVVVVGVVMASYLMLRWSLPVIQPGSHDASLDAIDVTLFGVKPTVWLEPHMSPAIVEYLAFFYFSYFILCGVFTFVALGPLASQESAAEFAVGTSVVYGFGQIGYALVPGFGPTHHLAHLYEGPLVGGFFWSCVLATVEAGSAMKDIFPSLHTAAPMWFALFAARRASRTGALPWKVLAVVTAIFAANIVVSTVALRWHYTVDLAAGAALAVGAGWIAPRAAALERGLRRRYRLPSAWAFE